MAAFKPSRLLRISKVLKNILRHSSFKEAQLRRDNYGKSFNENHTYKQKLKKSDLVKALVEGVVYNEDNVIVTNKPYGVSVNEAKKLQDNYLPQTFNNLNLSEVLSEVAERLGFDSLQIAMVPERFASGVIVLTGSEEAREKIKNCIKLSNSMSEFIYSYLVVTVGEPLQKSLETEFAFVNPKFSVKNPKSKPEIGEEVPEITEKWSERDKKYGKVEIVKWRHKVVSSSKFGSLVKVDISKLNFNSLRAIISLKCKSPILGDRLFGPRIEYLKGVPFVAPGKSAEDHELPEGLLEALQLTKREQIIIPNIVHLMSVTLSIKSNRRFHFSVFPPESFIWTCEQIGLNLNEVLPVRNV